MLLRLVTAERTRAPQLRADLLETARDPELGGLVLDRLVEGRLLSVSVDEDGRPLVELVHEALLRHWQRLADWLGEDEEGQRHLRAVGEATRAWERRSRTEDLLWRGAVLQEFQLWRGRTEPRLTLAEDAFVLASSARERRARRLRRTLVGAAFVVLSGGLLTLALSLQRAEDAAAEASLSALIANAQAQLGARQDAVAIRLALAAWEREPATPRTRTLLHQVLADRTETRILEAPVGVTSLQIAPGGERYSAAVGGDYLLFDRDLEQLAVLPDVADGVYMHTMSPDGGTLLTGGGDNPFRLWDVHDGSLRYAPDGVLAHWNFWSRTGAAVTVRDDSEGDGQWHFLATTGAVLAEPLDAPRGWASWHPDERRIAVRHERDEGAELVVYALEGRAEPLWRRTVPADAEPSWDPGGDELVVMSDGGTQRLSVDGEPLHDLEPAVERVLFAPDHTRLGLTPDDRVIAWEDDGPLAFERAPNCELRRVRVAPDSQRVVGVCLSGDAWVWDRTGVLRRHLEGHPTGIWNWKFAAGGDELRTFGRDGTLRSWSLDGGTGVTLGLPDWIRSCAWSATGEALVVDNSWGDLAVFGRDGRRLLGPTPGQARQTGRHADQEFPLGWSADGRLLLTSRSPSPDPQLRDVSAEVVVEASSTWGERPVSRPQGGWIPGTDRFLWALDDEAAIYDATGARVAAWSATPWGANTQLAWNADGTRLARFDWDGHLSLWSVEGELLAELPLPEGAPEADYDVVWHPDGDRIARSAFVRHGAGWVHAAPTQVWDVDGEPLAGEIDGFDRWSPDGRHRITRTEDGLGVTDEWGTTVSLDGLGEGGELIPGDGETFLVRHEGGAEVLWTWEGRELADVATPRGRTSSACWDPRGELVALGTTEGELRLVPLTDEALVARARELAPQPLNEELRARYLR